MSYSKSKLVTTKEAADMLNIHVNTVRRWSLNGLLKGYRIGPRGDRRFLRDDIIAVVSSEQYGYRNGED